MHVLMRESWTDERLDEFGKRIDERFDRVDEHIAGVRSETKLRFDRVDERFDAMQSETKQKFEQVDRRFDKIDAHLESMQRTMFFGVIAMSSSFIAGFAALVTQV